MFGTATAVMLALGGCVGEVATLYGPAPAGEQGEVVQPAEPDDIDEPLADLYGPAPVEPDDASEEELLDEEESAAFEAQIPSTLYGPAPVEPDEG